MQDSWVWAAKSTGPQPSPYCFLSELHQLQPPGLGADKGVGGSSWGLPSPASFSGPHFDSLISPRRLFLHQLAPTQKLFHQTVGQQIFTQYLLECAEGRDGVFTKAEDRTMLERTHKYTHACAHARDSGPHWFKSFLLTLTAVCLSSSTVGWE